MISYFNRYIEIDNGLIIYNLKWKSSIFIKNVNKREFLDGEYIEFKDILNSMGMFVTFDEVDETKTYYNNIINDNSKLMINIVMTYDCNCDCLYCFEKGNDFKIKFKKNCDKVISYIDNLMIEENSKELYINYFGGEPLLFSKDIIKINNYFRNKYKLYSNITTNGTLINSNLAKCFNDCGINSFQITIDGNKEIQDCRRPLKNATSSWNKTVEGILNLLEYENFKIKIRINIDENNSKEFYNIFYDLPKKITESKQIEFYLASVIGEKQNSYYENKSKSILNAWDTVKKFKLPIEINLPSYSPCSYNSKKNGFYIDMGGNIYSCGSLVGNKNFIEGTYKKRNHHYYNRINNAINKNCFKCEFFYECMGGCDFEKRSVGDGCPKIFFEEIYDSFIVDYLYKNDD